MDMMHWVLALMAVAGAAAAVWVLMGRGALAASAAKADAESAAAVARAVAAEGRVAELEKRAQDSADMVRDLTADVATLNQRIEGAKREHEAAMAAERRVLAEREAAVARDREQVQAMILEQRQREDERQAKLREVFDSVAADVARKNSEEFLKLAQQKLGAANEKNAAELERQRTAVEQMVKPIRETLQKTDEKLAAIEQRRAAGDATIKEQIDVLSRTNAALKDETGKLLRALREPQVRGRYGEVQLRRVAEIAGMKNYCDFTEQESTVDAQGRVKRPDMIVKLPNGRELIVDAKANLKPYMDAIEAAGPDEAEAHLKRFADGIAEQAKKLAKKGYYAEYDGADFVVMFVPGEQLIDAALAKRPDLLDEAMSNGVLLASPSSLIALLRAVAVGFGEARLAEEAKELMEVGRTLHERCATALEHVDRMGGAIEKVIESYNGFVGSYQSRVEPQLRKFEESGVKSAKELPKLEAVTVRPRTGMVGGGVGGAEGKPPEQPRLIEG